MPRGNGGIIGVSNLPGNNVAKGVWSLSEQFTAQQLFTWPGLIPPSFDYLIVGGGASGGCGGASGSVGGGGGAGGYRTGTISTIGSGQLFTITVGAGGALKTAAGQGNAGAASSLTAPVTSPAPAYSFSSAGGGGGGANTAAGAAGG